MPFSLPELPYALDALEPHIDARTMEIHHGKHHAAYVAKANAALEGTPLADETCPVCVLERIEEVPEAKRGAVRNNAGGHANHAMFWASMRPVNGVVEIPENAIPQGELAAAIDRDLGGLEKLKEQFGAAAANRFGSGWAWLCVNPDKKLHVFSTPNQDHPALPATMGGMGAGHKPILGLDVWEHAYYLNYQNRRPDYVSAWWNVVNWAKVGERYANSGACQSA